MQRDLSEIESSIRLTVSADVTVTDQVDDYGSDDYENRTRVRKKQTYSITASKRVEGIENVAEVLFEIMDGGKMALVYSVLDAEYGKNPETRPWEEDSFPWQETTVDVTLAGGVPAVLLAARKKAAKQTQENMVRQGYSVESVLTAWIVGSGFGYPNEEDVDFGNQLSQAARRALFTIIDQTPGGEIDVEALPDDPFEPARDRDEMLPA